MEITSDYLSSNHPIIKSLININVVLLTCAWVATPLVSSKPKDLVSGLGRKSNLL